MLSVIRLANVASLHGKCWRHAADMLKTDGNTVLSKTSNHVAALVFGQLHMWGKTERRNWHAWKVCFYLSLAVLKFSNIEQHVKIHCLGWSFSPCCMFWHFQLTWLLWECGEWSLGVFCHFLDVNYVMGKSPNWAEQGVHIVYDVYRLLSLNLLVVSLEHGTEEIEQGLCWGISWDEFFHLPLCFGRSALPQPWILW